MHWPYPGTSCPCAHVTNLPTYPNYLHQPTVSNPSLAHPNLAYILYPGTFLPSDPRFTDVGALYRAAETTLLYKRDDHGGHTSWSAAWEACLWARLGRKDNVWQALLRITDKYVNPRFFSLHPATQRQAAKGGADCITCFREKGGSGSSGISTPSLP